jgi:hypothetical protein
LKVREIITENGEILYMRIDKGKNIPSVRYVDYHIILYKDNGENIFGIKQYKELETVRIHNSYEIMKEMQRILMIMRIGMGILEKIHSKQR